MWNSPCDMLFVGFNKHHNNQLHMLSNVLGRISGLSLAYMLGCASCCLYIMRLRISPYHLVNHVCALSIPAVCD